MLIKKKYNQNLLNKAFIAFAVRDNTSSLKSCKITASIVVVEFPVSQSEHNKRL